MKQIGYRTATGALGLAALTLTTTTLTAPFAIAQSQAQTVGYGAGAVLEAGTVIPLRLDDSLGSNTSRKGDTFTATVKTRSEKDNDYYYDALPEGTVIEGVVRSAKPKTDKEPGALEIAFRRVRVPCGRSYPIEGSPISLDNKSVDRTSDGRFIAKKAHKTDRLTYVGYGAGAGLLVNLLSGKGLRLENILLGAGLGYLAGSLIKEPSSIRDVNLKQGTEIGLRLDRRLTLSGSEGDYYNNRYNNRRDDNTDESDRLYRRRDRNNNNDDNFDRRNQDDTSDIGVMMDDRDIRIGRSAPALTRNGVVLVPVRPVLDAARIGYRFNNERRELRANTNDGSVRVGEGSRIAVVNGDQRVRLEAPVQRINGTLYAPLRYFELVTGQRPTWDASSRTVSFYTRNSER